MPHYAKSRFHGHSCVLLPITVSLHTKAAVDSQEGPRGMLRFIFQIFRVNAASHKKCHALQRRQVSRPAICRHSSIKGKRKVTDFLFLFFSPFHFGARYYKVQNGNKGVVSGGLGGSFFSCFQ